MSKKYLNEDKKTLRKLQKVLTEDKLIKEVVANPSQEQIKNIANLYQSGQLIKTEQTCREMLKNYPQSIIILNILGATLLGQGKLHDAVK